MDYCLRFLENSSLNDTYIYRYISNPHINSAISAMIVAFPHVTGPLACLYCFFIQEVLLPDYGEGEGTTHTVPLTSKIINLTNHLILLKSDKNYDFNFLVKRCLFPNDLHDSYIICTVECTFHLTIDVQSLKTFYLLFAEIFPIL